VKHLPTISPCSGPAPDGQTSMFRAPQFMGKSRKGKVLEIKNDWRGPSRHSHTLNKPFDPYKTIH
jgi:hypothetical protein